MNNSLSKVIIVLCLLVISQHVYSHDTTHIHPLITDRIATLIQDIDNNSAYREIYLPEPQPDPNIPLDVYQRLYWGTDYDSGLPEGKRTPEYLTTDQIDIYDNYNNAIDGVVQEDVPSIKVLHHFYHATTSHGLTTTLSLTNGDPSSEIAMKYFNAAVQWNGLYTDRAKETAFFTFGQALHHVEDMSSPAHVHNDPHLTFRAPEKDDYEGYYLPLQKQEPPNGAGATLDPYFDNIGSPRPVDNPWTDIWGSNHCCPT
jgi:hypothetical protein